MSRLDTMWTMLNTRIDELRSRVDILEAKESAQTFDEVTPVTYATATATVPPGVAFRYISDGLREGGGTGVLAYFDTTGLVWRRVSDNGVVTT